MTTNTTNNLKICYLIIVVPNHTLTLQAQLTLQLPKKEKKRKGKGKAKKKKKKGGRYNFPSLRCMHLMPSEALAQQPHAEAHLGVPQVGFFKLRCNGCKLLTKLQLKLKTASKMSSYASRLQLVMPCSLAGSTYWTLVFILPRKILCQLKAFCRSFILTTTIEKP